MKKLLLSIILVSFIFTGCSNKLVEKAVEQGKTAIVNKQYNKALSSFQIALDEDKTNKEAKNLYDLVSILLQAQKAYEENKLTDAATFVDKLKTIEGYTLIKSEAEALKSQIEQKQKTEILTPEQSNKKNEKSTLLENEQAKSEEEKKKQQEMNQNTESSKQEQQKEPEKKEEQEPKEVPESKQETSKNKISEKEAIDIVKKKIIQVEGSFPEYLTISLDHVEGNNYVIHCYEVVNNGPEDQHTATYNWYYVNKYTGAVSSMF